MNFKKTTLAATVTALIALGVSGQAAASVYARSYLDIDNLSILISDNNLPQPGGATVNNFTFQIDDSAQLNNGTKDAFGKGCSGTPAANNCGDPGPETLDISAANAAGGDVTRTNNNFSLFGPGTDQYSNADAVIYTSQLDSLGANPTDIEQIAESELQSGTQAASESEISSTTGFTFAFTISGTGVIVVDLDSTLDILASINDPTGNAQSAQANVDVEFNLTRETGPGSLDSILWRPNGTTASGCAVLSGTTACTELADSFDLNLDAGTTTDGTTATNSRAGSGNHTITVTGLTDGNWTLTLNAATETILSRSEAPSVPEPGIIALLGAGLAGMGFIRRRKRNQV